jgi:hypothetical protein
VVPEICVSVSLLGDSHACSNLRTNAWGIM